MGGLLQLSGVPEKIFNIPTSPSRHTSGFSKTLSLIFILPFLFLASCSSTNHHALTTTLKDKNGEKRKIVVMPLDVELSLLTAGGVNEPNAEWTQAAKTHMNTALDNIMQNYNVQIIHYDPEAPGEETKDLRQFRHLYRAVGESVFIHQYLAPLPTRNKEFDWTMGPAAKTLKEKYNADYALFILVRDSYSSDSRKAMQFALALVGVGIQGGSQVGYSSLVDTDTGDIVWFNLLARGTGDLRTEKSANETVELLLDGLPN
tara:strand:+ start:22527 stop:23306 length:780 start_codon:yes stop_codon:yes gene_type:complete